MENTKRKWRRRSQKEKGSMLSLSDFPQDLIARILSQLPATFISGVTRRVCKSWAAVISSSRYFAETQLRLSKPCLLLQRASYYARLLETSEDGEFKIVDLYTSSSALHYSFLAYKMVYLAMFVDSCDGLGIYLQQYSDSIYVANPLTMRVTEVLGPSACTIQTSNMGSHYKKAEANVAIARIPRTGEVKLFCYLPKVSSCSGEWYTLALAIDESWRKITVMESVGKARLPQGYSFGRYIYFIADLKVVVLDADEETIRIVSLPKSAYSCIKAENCMYVVHRVKSCLYDIYRLDAYSGAVSHYHTMDIQRQIHEEFSANTPCYFVFKQGCLDPELLFSMYPRGHDSKTSGTLLGYNMKTQKLRNLGQSLSEYTMHLHTNSFLPAPIWR